MDKNYENSVERILCSERDIKDRVQSIARQIERYYENSDKKLLLLGILKGSVAFMADLMKAITIPACIDFTKVSSYGDSTISSGNVNIVLDLQRKNLPNENLIIIEDIVDSGRTLKYLIGYLLNKGAKSVRTVTLLNKPARREIAYEPEYVGKEIENHFVIGYGLDYSEKYRTLPYVGVIKPEYI
jgi:hypoxanthine phosphoribosyltransferase